MGLRDPIWQGIAAILAIAGTLIAILRHVNPDFKRWLEDELPYLKITQYVVFLAAIFLCVVIMRPLTQGVRSMLATSTPTPTLTPVPSFTPTLTPVPSETPIPTPVYTYLIYDNFDSGPLQDWSSEYGIWQMVNNRYTITDVIDDRSWTSGLTFIGDPSWTNYEVGAKVHLQNILPSINVAYFVVRAIDRDNYLLLEICDYDLFASDWSQGTWYVVQNGEQIRKAAVSFSSPVASDFSLLIQVQDDIVSTFIDGKQVNRWGDAPYLHGMTAIGIKSRYPDDPVAFDDFFIRTQP